MNVNPLAEVRAAIDAGDINRARDLLRPHLINQPTADACYLAYRVAVNDYQRRKFLNQALELDPFNQEADRALQALDRGETPPDATVTASQSGYASTSSSPAYFNAKSKREFGDPAGFGVDASDVQSYELAGIGQRFAANFLDGIIYLIVVITVFILIFNPFDQTTMNALTVGDYSSLQQNNRLVNIILLLFNVLYPVYFLTQRDGQTPGKMAMGIKIIKTNGQQLSFLDAFLRNVVGYQLSATVFGLGYLWAFRDPNNQTWHDKIVNTVVVKKR